MSYPLTLVFMILVFWRPQEWLLPGLYGWPVLDVIVYVSLLSLAMEIDNRKFRIPRGPAVYLSFGLWFATMFSHVAHMYFQGLLDTIPDSFKLCFFLVLLLTVADRVAHLRGVVFVMVGAAVMIAVHSLMQQRLGYGFGGEMPLWVFKPKTGEWQSRSMFVGIFSDPNDTAQILATCIPLAFAVPRRLNPVNLLFSGAVVALLFMGLLSTHSRGGMVALVAALACMVFLRLPTRWLPYAGAVGLAGGLVLCAAKGGLLLDASAQERVVFWGLANRAFKAEPLFGLGYGMFWQVTAGSRAAHNAFVSCYTEVGVFGYWFWFSLLQLGIIGCYRTRMALRKPKTDQQVYLRRLAGLSIASIVGFSAGGYFLSRAFIFPFFFLFGLLNAIPLVAQKMLPPDAPPLLDVRRHVYGSGTLSTLFSIVYIYVTILILNKAFYG